MQTTSLKGARLSLQQERLWAWQRKSNAFRVQGAAWLKGKLHEAAWQQALQQVVEQHEILHTLFYCLPGMEVPMQVINHRPQICCPLIDLEAFYPPLQHALLEQCFDVLQTELFDLAQGPLLRAVLFRLSPQQHLLLLDLAALCADAVTLPLLLTEVCRRYEAALQDRLLDEEPLQYIDVSAWQQELLASESAKTPREFWEQFDLSELELICLPFQLAGSNAGGTPGSMESSIFTPQALSILVDEELAGQLDGLAYQQNVSLATVLLACWQVLLWRLTEQAELLLGVAADGRIYEELAEAVGLYTRFVPLRLHLEPGWCYEQLVHTIHLSLQQAIQWQTYFHWPSELPPAETAAHYFPLAFEYEQWSAPAVMEGLHIELERRWSCSEPFALKLSVLHLDRGLKLEIYYDTQRFTPEQAQRLNILLQTVLHNVVAHPQLSLSRLPLLTASEQEALMDMFTGPRHPLPPLGLHQLFEAQVERLSDQPAVISVGEQLTYRQLNAQANQLARLLRRQGVGPNVLVGLCLVRSVQSIVGLLAILKAGGAYVPLDPASPSTRLVDQLHSSQVELLLTQYDLRTHFDGWQGKLLCLEELRQEEMQEADHNLAVDNRAEDLNYVIYTSGSTGVPKGVMIGQRSVVNYTLAMCQLLGSEPGWQYATVSTLAADLGNTSIFCALASGGCVQVLDYELLTSAQALARWVEQHPIDVLKIVPSHLAALLSEQEVGGAVLPRRALISGGEALPVSLLKRVQELGSRCAVYNHYGPTETTVGVLVNVLGKLQGSMAERVNRAEAATIPPGRPLANSEVYVLDANQQVVPIGMTGELYIGGGGLAYGYLGQAEQTAERFVPHPFSSQTGARLYRTGDLTRYTEDGKIDFVGRRDSQVKLRGYRIELGEIEAMLRRHPNVWEAAVLLRGDIAGGPQLVGYIVAKKQPGPGSKDLSDFLRVHLPGYMVPTTFVSLKDLPLTANGKLDRQRLPRPEPEQEHVETVLAAPRSPIEEILLDIWKELLAVPALSVHDDFFQLGGHSLLATQVIARIRTVLHVELSILSLFEAPTIAGLARRVEQAVRGGASISAPPLVPVSRAQELPLSFAQQRLWFLDQLEPGSTAYLLPRAQRLQGRLNAVALERSLQELVRRHEIVRTTFPLRAGRPVQIIHPAGLFRLPLVDLKGLAPEKRLGEARRLAAQERQLPCDLTEGPLLRVSLVQLDEQEHVLLLTMHHIISDGWSNDVFLGELTTLYRAFDAGQPSPLPPLPIQYADFALWQRQWLQGEALEVQLAYWREQLAAAPPLELPTDHPRPPVQSYRGAFQARQLPATLAEQISALSQREGVTPFMTLLAAFQVLLARYSGQTDISVGTPIANRTHAELEGLIGFFVNTLVLRSNLSGDPPFSEVLARVREVALGAYAHQDVPFEQLVEILQPERNLSRSPLFQIMFTMQQVAETRSEHEQQERLLFSALGSEHSTTKFDLTFFITSSAYGLHCGAEYNTDLFEADTISRLLEHWQILLEGIVAASQTRLSVLPLLSEAEYRLLLTEWNTTRTEEASRECLHEIFEDQVVKAPDAVALISEDEHLTYYQLNVRANQLAHLLSRLAVGPEVIVGVALDRSLFLSIGLLAILKAGGAYLPLDPSYPTERLAFMLADAQVTVLLTRQSLLERLPAHEAQVICLDSDWPAIAREKSQNPIIAMNGENVAYVIYTSGSTGTPKGVVVPHANVLRLFASTQDWFHFTSRDAWTLFHSYAFDFSVWELWGALLHGGRLILVSYEVSRSPETFYTLLCTHAVTVLNQTPSAFRQLIRVDETAVLKLPALRLIVFGGEALDLHSLRPWFDRHGEREPQFVNMYGITETTVHVTYRPLSWQDVQGDEGSMIGIPIPDLQVYVLDRYLQPVPIGIPGEMYIGGAGLARGYLNRPELTAERFVVHPFSTQPGARLYKTGDLARFLPNRDLEYLGRIDHQVKIRGFRIEPGEIEDLLLQHPAITECVVLAREDVPGDKQLVAYVIPTQGEPPTSSELHRFLQAKLPNYMVPSHFVVLEALPLTSNGKVDRRALPSPDQSRPELEEALVLPRTPTEEILAGVWASVLGVEQVGIHDNFFALGGDSIRSIQILSRARERGINFSLQQLFRHQTICELVQALKTEENRILVAEQIQPFNLISPQDRLRLPPDVEDAYPLTLLQAGMLFHSQYSPDSAVYHDIASYHLQAPLDLQLLRSVIQRLAACHSILRTSFDLSSFSEPLQLIHQAVDIPLQVEDLRHLSATEQKEKLAAWIEADKNLPFDLMHAPALRFQIHLRSEKSFQFALSLHHAILDGWSVASLLSELFKQYLSLLERDAPSFEAPEAPPTIQFRDFVALERKLLVSEEAREYWSQKLADSTSALLPRWISPDRTAHALPVSVLPIPISAEVSANLHRFAREIAVPIKSVLLAAHLRVLSMLTGQADVLTGLVTNGRPETTDGERILGLFLNTLPFRLNLAGGTWVELIQASFAAECELIPYRWYPLAEIQRNQGGHTLFETIFNFTHFHVYQSVSRSSNSSSNLQVLGRDGFEKTNFTLAANFSLDLDSSQIRLALRCNTNELCMEQVEAIGQYYANVLASLASDPHGRYELQSPLPPQQYREVLVDWNATAAEFARGKCIHTLFEEQVECMPDAVALVFEESQLTYCKVNQRANQLAHHLRALHIGPDMLVGICMERSLDMVVGLLGILKAGGAYVPLDPAYPPERLTFMIEDSQVSVLVTQPWLVNDLPVLSARIVCLSAAEQSRDEQETRNPLIALVPEQLAYVIYTSGSTGRPKGTAITHRSVNNFFNSMRREPGIGAQDIVLAITSLSFDITVLELLLPLTVGACVQVISREIAANATGLAAQIAISAITVAQATPTTWRMLLNGGWTGNTELKMLCGGEVLPLDLAIQLQQKGASLWNMYGPTETTIWSATGQVSVTEGRISIGRAIDNTQIYLLDRHFLPVPIAVTGELYIAGEGLTRGYLHHPELSAEKFIPNPFSREAGARMYRTGDLARWLPDGTIECLGRIDRQVKVRGFRIELGEIEKVLAQYPALKDCVVVLREDIPENKRLVAYVVAGGETAPSTDELRHYLRGKFPDYMLPSHFVMLETLPQTPNGKVDRRALPMPEEQETRSETEVAGARTPIEEALLESWLAVLGRTQVDIHDNFFELGGHSLLATQLISRVRTLMQVELPLRSLFEAPSIAQLAQQVEHALRAGQKNIVHPLVPVPRTQDIPLSFAQQRLWFLDQLEQGGTVYLMSSGRRLQGALDIAALQRSLKELICRQESLRTTFPIQQGQPVQVIHPVGVFSLPLVDLQGLLQEEREREARRLASQEAQYPCDLTEGPLFRLWLLRVDSEEYIVLATLHHIISDDWSMQVFYRELITLYRAFASGQPSPLPPLPIQYADFALWQRQWLQGDVLQSQLDYWRQRLANAPSLELPTDHLRPSVQTFRGARLSHLLPASLNEELLALSQREGVTLFMLLLAAFQLLLARYSGQSDISIGTPIANRTRSELEGLIGFFVNTLVLRTDLSGNPSFLTLLKRVREVALGAYAHQDVPFEQLVEHLQPRRDLSRSPLFQVMFVMQQGAGLPMPHEKTRQSLRLSGLSIEQSNAKFDLTLTASSSAQGLFCSLEYNTDLFEVDTIDRLLTSWHALLQDIVAHPQSCLAELTVLPAAERQQMLLEWNATALHLPEDVFLHRLFQRQVQLALDAVAVVGEGQHLSYEQIDRRANQLAHCLQERGVGPEVLVGVCLPRSPELVIALLAILKAGGGYVPLDPTLPRERMHFLISDAQLALILTTRRLAEVVAGEEPSQLLCVDQQWQSLAQQRQDPPLCQLQADNVAYVIYTSGSTGRPKGVMVSQGGLLNYLYWCSQHYEVSRGSGSILHSSIGFDLTVTSLFAPLLIGGTVWLVTEQEGIDGLVHLLEQQGGFSLLKVTPAHLAVINQRLSAAHLPEAVHSLIIGGEALSAESVSHWRTFAPQTRLINEYGPTETVVGCCIYEVAAQDAEARMVPIGQPIANTQLYILDEHLQPVPIGVIGELYIAGQGLARGYLKRADLTAERFLANPFSQEPGTRFYKSGDLARYRADGTIEYLGRRDEQVKLRGYRIELGEIETVLREHPAVCESVAVLSEDAGGDKRLQAFVVGAGSATLPSGDELRRYLREKLPDYMVPTSLVVLDALPLTANGKVDRRALAMREGQAEAGSQGWAVPRTPIEELLLQIWAEVLKHAQGGIDENFFERGGHSLSAVQVMARLRAVLGVDLPVRSLFEFPTITQLARQVEQALRTGEGIARPPLVPVPRTEGMPLSFAQQRLWFLDQVDPGNSAYLIHNARPLQGSLDARVVERSLQELVRRHESLRTTFQDHEGQAVQIIHSAAFFHLPLIDLSGLERAERRHAAHLLAEQEASQPCDLAYGPLLRGRLLRLAEQEHRLLITLHHIIADGWSMRVFYRELRLLYQAFASGQPSPLPPLPIQYADFAFWQREWLQDEVLEAQLDYWTLQLGGAPAVDLPLDHPRSSMQGQRGVAHFFLLPPEVVQGLVTLSQQEGVTLFMTLLAAFQVLLYRYSGQEDIVVGTDSANRGQLETEGLIGFFINLLVLRTNLSGRPGFREVLRRVREMVIGAYSHQETPFDLLVEKLMPAQCREQMPLVQALFVLQNLPSEDQGRAAAQSAERPSLSGITPGPGVDEERAAKFDLAVFLQERAGGMQGAVVYRRELFEPETITTMMERFIVLLQSIVRQPDSLIEQLDFFTLDELKQQAQEERAFRNELRRHTDEWFDLSGIDPV